MRRNISLGLFVLLSIFLLISPIFSQTPSVTPFSSGIAGVYNATLPTITSGNFSYLQTDSSGRLMVAVPTIDPCQSSYQNKSSVAINVTATSQLIALSGSTIIYVCHFDATLAGTTPSIEFEYGTGVVCATGTTVLTGTYLPTVGSEVSIGYGGTVMQTGSGNALCIVVAGTSPSVQGVLTYVQK